MILFFFNNIKTIKKFYIRHFICLFSLLFIAAFIVDAQPVIIDLQQNDLSFLNSNRTILTDKGNNGFNQGSSHKYSNIVSVDGDTLDGVLTILEVNNAEIVDFDSDYSIGYPEWFQPRIKTLSASGGYILYRLQLYNKTGEAVYFKNLSLTGIDVDGLYSTEREFIEVGGFASYTVNNPSQLEISNNLGSKRIRFLGKNSYQNGDVFENNCSFIATISDRPVNELLFSVGQTNLNSLHNHLIKIGSAGGTFTSPKTVTSPYILAVDDVITIPNTSFANDNILNILSNDFYYNKSISLADVVITLLKGSSSSLITLDTKSGNLSVGRGAPSGNYTLKYLLSPLIPSEISDTASVSIKILESDLEVSCNASGQFNGGNNIQFTITVSNHGPTIAKDVSVQDVLTGGLTLVKAVAANGTWQNNNWTVGTLSSGATATSTLTVNIPSGYVGEASNKATVTSTSYDPVTLNNVSTKTITVEKSYDLSVSMSDSIDPVIAGTPEKLFVVLKNNGPGDATDITLNVNPSPWLNVNSIKSSSGIWNSPVLNISKLVARDSVVMEISSTVNKGASGTITSSVSILNNGIDKDHSNDQSSISTFVYTSADLAVDIVSDEDTILPGDMVYYTLTVVNNGPGNASFVQLFDELPDLFLNPQYSTDDGQNWITWHSPLLIGNINAYDNKKILVRTQSISNLLIDNTMQNTAKVLGQEPDYLPTNNSASTAIVYDVKCDLSLIQYDPVWQNNGREILYTFKIDNNGPGYSRLIELEDTLCSGIKDAKYSINNGVTWNNWTGKINIPELRYPGSLTLLIRGEINPGFNNNLESFAKLSSETTDQNLVNNVVFNTKNYLPNADLLIYAIENKAPISTLDTVNYDIVVRNNGNFDARNVIISDTIDQSQLTDVNYSVGSGWNVWSNSLQLGSLLADSTFHLMIRGVVKSGASSPIITKVRVASSTSDLIVGNNVFTLKNNLNESIDLSLATVTKDTVFAGDTIVYGYTIKNNSSNLEANNLTFIDNPDKSKVTNPELSLDDGLNWIEWTGINNFGKLGAGKDIHIKIRYRVYSDVSGFISNRAEVFCDSPDKYRQNSISSTSIAIEKKVDIGITQTLFTSSSSIYAGSSIDILFTCKNNGPSDAFNFTVNYNPSMLVLTNPEFSFDGVSYFNWPISGTLNIGTFDAGKEITILMRGIISSSFIGSFINDVTVHSDEPDNNKTNNLSSINVAVGLKADLEISGFTISNPIQSGNTVTMVAKIKNNGPSNVSDLSFINRLPAELENLKYSIDGGSSWKEISSGISSNIGYLSNGDSIKLLLKGSIKSATKNGTIISDTISISSKLTVDLNSSDNSCWTKTTVQTASDLSVTTQTTNYKPDIGSQFILKYLARNNGPSVSTSVLVNGLFFPGFQYISDTGLGKYNRQTGCWTIGQLNNTESTMLQITVKADSSGTSKNSVIIMGDSYETYPDNNVSQIIINTDHEAQYFINQPLYVDSYSNGQILATVTDKDGAIVSATWGTLPQGIGVNQTDGSIFVLNSSLLVAGNNDVSVTTTDEKGNKTTQSVIVNFIADNEAVYHFNAVKNENDYAKGEQLASVTDKDGVIVSVQKISGSLPPGSSLDNVTGEIKVTDPLYIVGGNYESTIRTTDNKGGQTTQDVIIKIKKDRESIYTTTDPLQLNDYKNGDLIASVADSDGAILSVKLISGELPKGIILDPTSGRVTVSDVTQLFLQTKTLRIETEDETGGITNSLLRLTIGINNESIYTIPSSRNIDSYFNGDTLAWASDVYGTIISAKILWGSLPPGTILNSESGLISVNDKQLLEPGDFSFGVETKDDKGSVSSHLISLEMIEDIEAKYHTELPKNIYSYSDGDILATVTDGSGTIVSAQIVSGTLPDGIYLNPKSGLITVTDHRLLIGGSFRLQIKTEDNTGGITISNVAIVIIASDLSINCSYQPEIPVAGDLINCVLTIANSGLIPTSGVKIICTLPTVLETNFYSFDQGTTWLNLSESGQIQIGLLDTSSVITLWFRGRVNQNYTGLLNIHFTVESNNDDTNSKNNTAEITAQVVNISDLKVEITDEQNDYFSGRSIDYTIAVTNGGPSFVTGARINFTIPHSTKVLQWTAIGTNGTHFNPAGSDSLNELIDLPANGLVVYNLRLNVPTSFISDLESKVSITNPINSSDPFPENNVAIDRDEHNKESSISISVEANKNSVYAGDTIVYTIRSVNKGPADATGVIISDVLPAGITLVNVSTGGVTTAGIVSWKMANMTVNTNFMAMVLAKVNCNVGEGTLLKNHAFVKSDNLIEPIESSLTETTVHSLAKLSVNKLSLSPIGIAGTEVSYQITIINNGPSDAANVIVRDTMPEEISPLVLSNGGTFLNSLLDWKFDTLRSGSSISISVDGKVGASIADGSIINNVAWTWSDNSITKMKSNKAEIIVHSKASLTLNKVGDDLIRGGELLNYSLKITNNGPSDAFNIHVKDTLSDNVRFNMGKEGIQASGNVVEWNIHVMKAGESLVGSYNVLVDDAVLDKTIISNKAVLKADNSDKEIESNTVMTQVTSIQLKAIDDVGKPVNGFLGGIAVEDVRENDRFDGELLSADEVILTFISSSNNKIYLDENSGEVIVKNGTPEGTYELKYRICRKVDQMICSEANVKVVVQKPDIIAVDDDGDLVDNYIGGVAVLDVIANDLYNGNPINHSDVTISLVKRTGVQGIDLNQASGEITVAVDVPAGQYQLTYRICDVINPDNCSEATVTIHVTDVCDVIIPDGFSPNGDGIHDLFMITCLTRYPKAIITIFNRWGNIVYTKENYGNEDIWGFPEAWWDGSSTNSMTVGNQKLPSATYFYILDFNDGKTKPRKGSIFLSGVSGQ